MRAVISVIGKDSKGIIAKTSMLLYENDINILDISQTIVQDYFNMVMIVDINKSSKHFGEIADDLAKVGDEIGVQIKVQSEDIFNIMHRI